MKLEEFVDAMRHTSAGIQGPGLHTCGEKMRCAGHVRDLNYIVDGHDDRGRKQRHGLRMCNKNKCINNSILQFGVFYA